MRLILPLIAVFVALATLNACGIKPKNVEPPEHVEEDDFPHTYPSPELNTK